MRKKKEVPDWKMQRQLELLYKGIAFVAVLALIMTIIAMVLVMVWQEESVQGAENNPLVVGCIAEWGAIESNEVSVVQESTETVGCAYEAYPVDADQMELFARVIYLETGGQSEECQIACGSVILNRLSGYGESWNDGDTIEEVVSRTGQYSTYKKAVAGGFDVSEESYYVAEYLLTCGVPERYQGIIYQSKNPNLGSNSFEIDGEWFAY